MLGLGTWLEKNGQAIFETRPWIRAEGVTTEDIDVRFTQKEETLFVFLLDTPKQSTVTIKSLKVAENATIKWLGYNDDIEWVQKAENLTIMLPNEMGKSPACAISITPKPSSQK
ncbi:MAG: alpha-L-fucosidase C-terminal domain-containing protein [Promethearchaeota archaeon]